MSNAKIFFSYAREDAQFALRLATDIRMAGIDIWMDQLDIRAGTRWDTEVENALQLSKALLVILTPSSAASHNVYDEISYALDEGKRVIPVLLKECTIHFRLRRIQYADFTKSYDQGFNELLKTLDLTPNKDIAGEKPLQVISPEESITESGKINTPNPSNENREAKEIPGKPAPVKNKPKLVLIHEKKGLAQFDAVNFSYDRKKDMDTITGILYVHSHSLEYKSGTHDFTIDKITEIQYKPAADGVINNYMKVVYYNDNVRSEIYFTRFTFWGDKPTLIMFTRIEELIGKKDFILFKVNQLESITDYTLKDTSFARDKHKQAAKTPDKPALVKSKPKPAPISEIKGLAQFDAVNFSYDRRKDMDTFTGIMYVNSHSIEYKSSNHDFTIHRITEIQYKPAAGGVLNNYLKVVYYKDNGLSEIYFTRFTFWGDKPTLIIFIRIEELIGEKKFVLFKTEG